MFFSFNKMDKIKLRQTKFQKLHDEIKIKEIKVTIYDSVPISAKFETILLK